MKGLLYLGGVAISIVFAYLTFRGFNWQKSAAALDGLSLSHVLAAILAIGAGYAVRIARWQSMLAIFRPQVRFADAMGPFLGSFALNGILPLRAGDVARVFAFQSTLRVKPVRVMSTMLLERLLDLLVLLMFLGCGLLLVGLSLIPDAVLDFAGIGILVGVVGLLGLVFVPRRGAWLARRLSHSPLGRLPGVKALLNFGARTLFAIAAMCTLGSLARLIALSIVAWAFEGCAFFAIARELSGDTFGFGPWFAMATGTLGTLIPSTPGHVGTFDYFTKVGFMAFGDDPGMAALQALIIHAVLWVPITLVGSIFIVVNWGGHAWANLRGLAKLKAQNP